MSEAVGSSPAAGRGELRLALVGVMIVVLTLIGPPVTMKLGSISHWIIFVVTGAAAAWAGLTAERLDRRWALAIIAIAAIAMRCGQLAIEPYWSDDIYRYVWDGRVQAAGINPYRYIPVDAALAHLRDAAIFPKINRADYAPTIYPPVAQMFFLLATRLGESVLVMKLALVACEAVMIGATLVLLARLSLPATRIAIVAWHPLAIWEIAGSGHIDALMCALLMVAVVIFTGGRTLLAGVVATAAALVKPTALLALPVFWRPWRFGLPLAFVATLVLLYAPYMSVGSKVFGFLGGYVAEEGLNNRHGFRLLMIVDALVTPVPEISGKIYAAAFALLMLALAFRVSFRVDRGPAASVAALTLLLTAFLVVLTPHYPWYYLAIVPFLAVYPWSWTLWVLTIAGVQSYNEIPNDRLPDFVLRQLVFNLMVLIAIARDLLRLRNRPAIPEHETHEHLRHPAS